MKRTILGAAIYLGGNVVLQVVCPTCAANFNIRDDLQGKSIICGGCSNPLSIGSHSEQTVQMQVVSKPTPASRPIEPVSRQDSTFHQAGLRTSLMSTKVITPAILIAIACGAVFAANYFLSNRQVVQKSQQVVQVEKPSRMRISPQAATQKSPLAVSQKSPQTVVQEPSSAVTQEPSDDLTKEPSVAVTQEAPQEPTRVTPPKLESDLRESQLHRLPTQIDLPSVEDTGVVVLFEGIRVAELQLVSLSTNLTLDGKKLYWKEQQNGNKSPAFAALAIRGDEVLFRWFDEVPKKAEGALRNSVMILNYEGDRQYVALRQPVIVDPCKISLKRNMQRIKAKFDHLPPMDSIRADFTGIERFPYCQLEGIDIKGMKIKDMATIRYDEADAAYTKLTFKKIGRIVAFELVSRYQLPSGPEVPMSISQGRKIRKQINKQMSRAKAAEESLPELLDRQSELFSYLPSLDEELHDLHFHNPHPSDHDAEIEAEIRLEIDRINFEIGKVKKRILKAERLIKEIPGIEKDIDELDRVSVIAGKLNRLDRLTHRIYMLVAGREVDLLIAGPLGSRNPANLSATPPPPPPR